MSSQKRATVSCSVDVKCKNASWSWCLWCEPSIPLQTSAKRLAILRCSGWHEVHTQHIPKIDPRTAKSTEFTSKSIPRRPKTQYLQVNRVQVVQNHSIYKQIHSNASQNTIFPSKFAAGSSKVQYLQANWVIGLRSALTQEILVTIHLVTINLVTG